MLPKAILASPVFCSFRYNDDDDETSVEAAKETVAIHSHSNLKFVATLLYCVLTKEKEPSDDDLNPKPTVNNPDAIGIFFNADANDVDVTALTYAKIK